MKGADMTILIKGAKMPKNCKTCGFVVCDDEYSPEYWCPIVRDSVDNYVNCRHKLCPLVEIPTIIEGWVHIKGSTYKCPNCGTRFTIRKKWVCCPVCGQKLSGVKEQEHE